MVAQAIVHEPPVKDIAPAVSIIVIAFNEIDLIGECLTLLLTQSYSNFEVIVYDNASTDGTADYIAQNFPQVRLLRGTENLGFGGANNQAAQLASGKYLAFVNDDAYVTPNWLEPIIDLMESDPSIGGASAELMCLEDKDVVLCHGNGIHLSGVAYLKDRGKHAKPAAPIEAGAISGAAFVINRELFLEVGGFESMFFLYYEDTDLSLRLRLLGKRCVAVPGAVVYHNSESRFGLQKLFFLERNRYLSLLTLIRADLLFWMAPSMLVMELLSWGYAFLQGKDALQTKARAWRDVYNHRAWIQNRQCAYTHKLSPADLLDVFTPEIHMEYVNSSKLTGRIAWLIGYLVAAPTFFVFHLYKIVKTKIKRDLGN